ncbi:MAG: helix-turn-helix domain-containing protein [Flavisolibacter sp.]
MQTSLSTDAVTAAFNLTDEKLYDGQEIMQILKISIRTLQYWRSKGVIPYYKVRNKIYYRQKDVEAMVQQCRLHKK